MSNVQNQVPKRLSCDPALHKELKLLSVQEGRPLQEITDEFLRKSLEMHLRSAAA